MLHVNRVSKRFDYTPILRDISFTLGDGEKVALVGANGSGKSTLMKIIAGELEADSGTVTFSGSDTLGYLPQKGKLSGARTIEESFLLTLSAHYRAGPPNALMPAEEAEAYRILAGLGSAYLTLDMPLSQLSGGELTRVQLAALFLTAPTILLLDEPTNHLDIPALEWLEQFLQSYTGSVLLISHDRVFLDRVVSCVYELDELTQSIRKFPGDYSNYARVIEEVKAKAYERWKDQQTEIKRLKADWIQTAEQARWSENQTKDSKMRRYAKKVAKKGTAKKKRLERYLEDEARIEKPMDKWRLRVNFGEPEHHSAMALQTEGLSFAYDERLLFEDLHLTLQGQERVALIGPNGCGKSTLLKVLLGELPPLAGTYHWGGRIKLGYMAQNQDTLDPSLSALETLQAIRPMTMSETYHFLHYFLLDEDQVILPTASLSFGQRSRLMLACLVAEGANVLVLDEPVNYLDIPSREQFEQALQAFTGGVLLVAHDRAFISRVTEKTWLLEDGKIKVGWSEDLV
jgi:ATP-binding cassette subfamily F protein 3